MKTIVIDPGHGGWDLGSTPADGTPEKSFNLELALALRAALRSFACRVVLTRETDAALAPPGDAASDLRKRAAVANREHADLLISLHHGSLADSAVRGGSLWVWTDQQGWLDAATNHRAPKSFALAEAMYQQFRRTLRELGIPTRDPIRCSDFGVLRETEGPGVLLECFFGSNPEDLEAARKPGFVPQLAEGIARGLALALDLPLDMVEHNVSDAGEMQALKDAGLIGRDHRPDEPVTWGQLATLVNRIRVRE